jgi:hypothetical protein
MTRWTFFARILPERFPLHATEPFSWTSEARELGFRYQVTIRIRHGHVVAATIIESGPDEIHTLKNLIEGDIRKVTDYIGYLNGISFDVDMISATCDDERTESFSIAIPVLRNSREKGNILEMDKFLPILHDLPAQIVLADFREAMRNPVGTGFFCYRAIEAMMQSMKATATDNDGPAWERLRQHLQVDRSAIDAIKDHADYPRHGKIFAIRDADRQIVFRLTDEIIRRYFEYLRRERAPLSDSDFHLLVHP